MKRKIYLLTATSLSLLAAHPALAQDTGSTGQSGGSTATSTDTPSEGDIIVTATKRAQTLQDVPISVAVATPETIERAQIRDIIDLQSVVPSLRVTQLNATGQTNFVIRGFGNGNGNDGIESSVGVFVDGVYRARTSAALDDLPEVERVEVLRGPQSTLFGKNVSAGAINIVTAKPQFDWGGKAELTVGNYGSMIGRANITGPISDTIAFRLSGSVNQRDGFFKNLTTGQDIADRNRYSARADILFEPTSDFSLRIIGDYTFIKERCCGVTSVYNGPATLAIGAPVAYGGLGKPISDTTKIFDRNVIFNTDPTNKLTGKGISGQADWDVGFANLTSITAYRNQTNSSNQDIDFTGADISSNKTANNIDTFTQEIRLASKGDGPINWLVGGFFQDEHVKTGRDISFGQDMRAFINALTGGQYGLLYALESLQNAVTPSITPGSYYFNPGVALSDNYKLHQTSYSLFGQVDFKVTSRLTITGGLAYLNDKKVVTSDVRLYDRFSLLNLENVPQLAYIPFAAVPSSISGCLLQKGYVPGATAPVNLFGASLGASLPGPGSAPCPTSPAGVNPFGLNALQFFYGNTANHAPVNIPNANESGILTGDKVTYTARAAYDFGKVNVYVSYATGWKAGAFNLSSDSRPPDANGVGRTAAPENVTVYEAGLKARFHGGYLNLAVFKQTIKGFQSNAFTGLGYSLVNAGQESVRGVEVDASYAPVKILTFNAALTYLDPKYDSFKGAACVIYDTVRCPVNPTTGLMPNFRDLSGDKPAGIPEWTGTFSATLAGPIAHNISAYLRGEYDYQSDTQTTETTPPNLSTWGVHTVNASLGLSLDSAQLGISVWVRNLTNDNYLVSNFPTVAQSGSYSGYPSPPRTWGVTLSKAF